MVVPPGGGGGGGCSSSNRQTGRGVGGSGIVVLRYQIGTTEQELQKQLVVINFAYGGKIIHTFTGSANFVTQPQIGQMVMLTYSSWLVVAAVVQCANYGHVGLLVVLEVLVDCQNGTNPVPGTTQQFLLVGAGGTKFHS